MIEAWTRRSAIMTSSSVVIASKTPALASRQLGKRIVSSVPRNSVSLLLQLDVDVLRAADEADRGHAEAVRVEALVRGLHHLGMVARAEVVVGAHVDDRAAAGSPGGNSTCTLRVLRRVDDPLLLVDALALNLLQLGLRVCRVLSLYAIVCS